MGFLYISRILMTVASLLCFALCGVLLGLSAWMIAYRYSYETWHGVAQISLPGSELDGKAFKYTPLHMHMSSYYLTLAVACTGLLLTFSMAFVNSRKDLHSRIINHTFHRLPSTIVPATLLLLLSVTTIVYDFELNRRSTIFSPFYVTTNFHAAVNGTYTLDNFSCQLSRWLDGRQKQRTAQPCDIGRVTRFVLVPLVLLAWSVVFAAFLSMRAEAKRKSAQRHNQDVWSAANSVIMASPYTLYSDFETNADLQPDLTHTKELWSPVTPTSQQRTVNELADNVVYEKSGREVVEKEG